MKKTKIKKWIDDLEKAVEQKYGKKGEIMTFEVKTCMDPKGNMFAHVEAVVDFEGDDNSYKVAKDYDL